MNKDSEDGPKVGDAVLACGHEWGDGVTCRAETWGADTDEVVLGGLMEPKPKRKCDWVDRLVRLEKRIATKGGDVFERGTVMRVTRNHGGLHLEDTRHCFQCDRGRRREVKGVQEGNVYLLSKDSTPAAENVGGLMLAVGVQNYNAEGGERHVLHAMVTADMSRPFPDPPITQAEMQPVCFAAKMALAKILRARRGSGE